MFSDAQQTFGEGDLLKCGASIEDVVGKPRYAAIDDHTFERGRKMENIIAPIYRTPWYLNGFECTTANECAVSHR